MATTITAKEIGCLTPGRHRAADNLYLTVSSAGARSWVFLYRWSGKSREAGLGKAGNGGVSLGEARRRAEEGRGMLRQKPPIDPLTVWRSSAARSPTFREAAVAHLARNEGAWKNPKHRAQWRMTLLGGDERNYCKKILDLPCERITTRDVLDVIAPIWSRAPETASRLRGRIETVLDAERALRIGKDDADEKHWRNPAQWRGNLEPLLPTKTKQAKALGLGGHFAALPYSDVPAFMTCVRADTSVVARALEFLVLTATRTGEVLGAKWTEFDLAARLWTIPADRMKAGKPHSVPLSERAMTILNEMEALGSDHVFPGRNGALSNMVFLMALRRMGIEATPHGFRSSFRDWAGDSTHFPRDIVEHALAHAIESKTEAAYRRGDALEKRRSLMGAWDAYCGSSPISDNVIASNSDPEEAFQWTARQ
jgi:integrase